MQAFQNQFDALNQRWQQMEHSAAYYSMGPFILCIESHSAILAEKIGKAFCHLQCNKPLHPDFTVRLWDCAHAPQKLPSLSWSLITHAGYQGYRDDPFYLHYFETVAALSFIHLHRHEAYYIVKDHASLPWWVSGSPLQVILHVWLREKNLQLTHTAAVGNTQQALLLTGKGGSGKSTTSFNCMRKGLRFIGEDYCLIQPGETHQHPQVYSVYQTAKWTPQTQRMFPQYQSWIANPESALQEKGLLYYQDCFAQQMTSTPLSIKAIISLSIAENSPTIQRSSPQDALKNLMMSTLKQLPFYDPRSLDIFQSIVSHTPCYHLYLGEDHASNVAVLQQLLDEE